MIREDIKRGVYVDGITEVEISSPEDAYRVLDTGARNRHVAATSMNRESSRSHSVFTLIIQSKVTDGEITDVRESRFNLVDLAGSERQKLTATTGIRLKEAGNINKSLLALGNVINALVDIANGKARHVHYRDSKLTFLLRDSLGGNAKTFIIANVSPSLSCYSETMSTLRFASRAKMIQNRAVVNQEFQGDVMQMQEEIKRLKHELLLSHAHHSNSGVNFNWEQDETYIQELGQGSSAQHMRAILVACLKRKKVSDDLAMNLREQADALRILVDEQKRNAQHDKMIIKFRESMIDMLRKKESSTAVVIAEVSSLKNQIEHLNQQVDSHPEVARFAAENLELRELLWKFEHHQEEIERYEMIKLERSRFEQALSEQIIALQSEIDRLQAQQSKAEMEKLHAAEDIVQIICMEQKLRKADLDKGIIEEDLKATRKELDDLKHSTERSQMRKDLEIKRLREAVESMNIGGESLLDLTQDTDSIIANLRDENARLKLKYTNMEHKTRRVSDIAVESTCLSEKRLTEMTDKVVLLENGKTELETANAKLTDELSALYSEFEIEKDSRLNSEAAFANEKYTLEAEVIRLENSLRSSSLEVDSLTEKMQVLKDDHDDASSAFEQSQSERESIKTLLAERDTEIQKLSNTNTGLQSQVSNLEQVMEDAGQSKLAHQEASESLSVIKMSLHETEELLQASKQDVVEKTAQLSQVLTELDNEKRVVADLHAQCTEERQKYSMTQKQNEQLIDDLSALNIELVEMRVLTTEFEKSESARVKELQQANEQVSALKNEILDLSFATEESAANYTLLKERLDCSNVEHAKELADNKSEIERLRSSTQSLKDLIMTLSADLEMITDQLASHKSSAAQELFDSRMQLNKLQSDCDKYRMEKRNAESCLEMAQEDNTMLLEQVKHVEVTSLELDEYKALGSKSDLTQLKCDLEKKTALLDEKDKELQRETSRLDSISERLGQLSFLQGNNKSLEQQFDFILKRNEHLEEENAKLVQHNNFKQKLQYHLQIKQENNQLRADNQKLSLELDKLQRKSKASV